MQEVWWLGVGWGRGVGEISFVSIVGTMGIGGIRSGLSLVFFVHLSKWVTILMLRVCYY